MKKYFLVISMASFLLSCNSEQEGRSPKTKTDAKIEVKSGEVKSKLSSGSQDAEALKAEIEKRKIEEEKREQERISNLTTMEIFPESHNFGDIPKATPVTTTFKIKNTGDKPLIIQDAQASCGCTVPKKPEKPIMPGEEDDLEVTFESTPGQEGTSVSKSITIAANIPGDSKVVTIRGKVSE